MVLLVEQSLNYILRTLGRTYSWSFRKELVFFTIRFTSGTKCFSVCIREFEGATSTCVTFMSSPSVAVLLNLEFPVKNTQNLEMLDFG